MSRIDHFHPPGPGSGDESSNVNKSKFKQKMKQVEAVEKTDPDQQAKKKRTPQQEEIINAMQNALVAPLQNLQNLQINIPEEDMAFPSSPSIPLSSDNINLQPPQAQNTDQSQRSNQSQDKADLEKQIEAEALKREENARNIAGKKSLKSDADIYKEKKSPAKSSIKKPKPIQNKNKIADASQITTVNVQEPSPMTQAPIPPQTAPQGSYLSPQVHELFQTMIGLVMVKQLEGMKGTQMEISLNNPEYEKSLFYGLKIVITEYKTAPGAYNIEFQGNGAQNSLLTQEAGRLMAAFHDKNYNLPFKINRLDVTVKGEDKDQLFKRKESIKGGQKDTNDKHTT